MSLGNSDKEYHRTIAHKKLSCHKPTFTRRLLAASNPSWFAFMSTVRNQSQFEHIYIIIIITCWWIAAFGVLWHIQHTLIPCKTIERKYNKTTILLLDNFQFWCPRLGCLLIWWYNFMLVSFWDKRVFYPLQPLHIIDKNIVSPIY